MTISNGYCTLAELKARLGIDSGDLTDDAVLEAVIEGVSRFIDDICGRRFYTTTSDETRYYSAEDGSVLDVDDLASLTTLATDHDGDGVYETTWDSDDYVLEPYNAALDGRPYTRIRVAPGGRYGFPTTRRGVKIVGKFGWSTVPKPVCEAAILLSARLFKRKDAVFGVTGSAEMGQMMVIPKLDPDVAMLLMGVRRADVLAC